MNNRLFEIAITNNGYTKEFNESIRYMLEQLPECEVKKEKDGQLLVMTSSIQAADLLNQLYKADCISIISGTIE